MNADTWLGHSLLEECLDPETGEVLPIAIVTDNGAPSARPPSLVTSPLGPSSPTSVPATARPRPTASSSASSRLSSTSISTAMRSVTELPTPPLSTATRPSTTTSARTRRSPSALRSRPGGTSTVPPVRIFSPRKLSHFLDTGHREGIRPNVYYSWLKDFMEAGKSRLQADTVRDATRAEVDGFRRENEQLKQLVAELSLEVLVLKKTALPEFD